MEDEAPLRGRPRPADEDQKTIAFADPAAPANRKSYAVISFLYWYYSVVFTITVAALPALTLQVTNDNDSRAAYLYGFANFVRYIMEFFVSPFLGSAADYTGRKPMLIMAFLICAVEFGLLCFFPSVGMIFFTRAMAGMGDCAQAVCYTIATDIALFNKDAVTNPYGLIAAMMGLGFVVGPLLGGLLVEMISVRTCFLVSMFISLVGALLTALLLEESLQFGQQAKGQGQADETNADKVTQVEEAPAAVSLWARWNEIDPITPLVAHFSNPTIRRLSYPLMLSAFTIGIGSMWYIYISDRYGANATVIGCYLAFYGLSMVFAQGYLIKKIIPALWNEQQAAMYGYLMQAFMFVGSGVMPEVWMLFVIVGVISPGLVADPALKALIVKASLAGGDTVHIQGNLQGTLSGIRTLSTALGSLVFPSMYSICLSTDSSLYFVPFAFGGCCFLLASLLMNSAPVDSSLLSKSAVYSPLSGTEEPLLPGDEEAQQDISCTDEGNRSFISPVR